MSTWLNTTVVVDPDIAKPCVKLRYCPYGQLVEEYPLHHADDYPHKGMGDRLACTLDNNGGLMQFGHDCPVHYHREHLYIDSEGQGTLAPDLVSEA